MKAVVLAGGKGTRLKPYTITIPKPLVPIGDYSILEIVIRRLKKYGFTDIVLTVNHMNELIKAYFKDGEQFGVKITYSEEGEPLGTAGPLTLLGDVGEDFLVVNGDILTDLDFAELADYHKKGAHAATVATFKKEVQLRLGALELDSDKGIRKYIEKPRLTYDVSTGVYIFNKKVMAHIPKKKYFDLPQLITRLIEKKEHIKVYEFEGLWFDIGTPSDYEEAVQTFNKDNSRFL